MAGKNAASNGRRLHPPTQYQPQPPSAISAIQRIESRPVPACRPSSHRLRLTQSKRGIAAGAAVTRALGLSAAAYLREAARTASPPATCPSLRRSWVAGRPRCHRSRAWHPLRRADHRWSLPEGSPAAHIMPPISSTRSPRVPCLTTATRQNPSQDARLRGGSSLAV